MYTPTRIISSHLSPTTTYPSLPDPTLAQTNLNETRVGSGALNQLFNSEIQFRGDAPTHQHHLHSPEPHYQLPEPTRVSLKYT